MKKFTKSSIVLIIAIFVMGMFLACTPTDGEGGDGGNNDGGDGGNNDGGDGGDGGDSGNTGTVVLSENFEELEEGEITEYTVTDDVNGGETEFSWEVGVDNTGNKMALVNIGTVYHNDTRLEFTKVDLASYTKVTLEFEYALSYTFAMCDSYPDDEGNSVPMNGEGSIDGGYDMRVMIKEGDDGEWEDICHEDTFEGFEDGVELDGEFHPHSVDISDKAAGKSDIVIAFWVVGNDVGQAFLDNVKITGEE